MYTNAFEYSVCSLVFVYECVEGESVAPGGSEVVDVDVAVSGRALAHPGEQRALHVALAQLSHHVLQHALHLDRGKEEIIALIDPKQED